MRPVIKYLCIYYSTLIQKYLHYQEVIMVFSYLADINYNAMIQTFAALVHNNYSLAGSCMLRKFTAGQLAGTIFLLPKKNHMVRRALKLQRTCRPLTINEPYRQACGMALEKYFQQKNCPRQSPQQRCRAHLRFLFLSNYGDISSPAAGAEGIHKWSVSVLREEKIFGRPFPRKRLSSKRSAFTPFSMMN